MQVFIITLLILINLILWLVFFLKFKRLFSTDDIIQKTREQYELLLSDVNRNALQNIDLIDMKIEELKSLIDIADRRLSTVQNESQLQQTKSQIAKTYANRSTNSNKEFNVASAVVENNTAYNLDMNVKKTRKKVNVENLKDKEDSKKANKKTAVKSLASQNELNFNQENSTAVNISDYKLPNIYMSENPIVSKQSDQEQVKKLYNSGYTVEQIAHELNKSTIEVELMVEML